MDASHIIPLMFPLPEGLLIEDLSIADALLIVRVFSTSLLACCPHCAQPSSRIHGRYVRTVSDLPCVGRRVVLKLPVRKFLCLTAACPHKIFTERLPDLVPSYARITNRLREALV